VVGRVAASYGVRGSLKVTPFASDPATLARCTTWYFKAPRASTWDVRRVSDVREHGATVLATVEGIDSREQAMTLRGSEVAVRREDLPPPAQGEMYLADLVGLRMVNREGVDLGRIEDVQDAPAHPLLRVVDDGGAARLVPYVPAVVESIDHEAATLHVDWRADY
jgi:16S rRNA processing protein RimM